MQILLHPSAQRQGNGSSDEYIEPDFKARSILIRVTAISVNLLGSITFRLQHSADGSDWLDVPNMLTGAISATGTTTLTVDPGFACFDHLRISWTFNNANSVTFSGSALGTK